MFKIALIVWMIGGTTLAGIAIMVVLAVPSLAVKDMQYIPIAAIVGFVVAVPIAYVVAKRIRALTAS
jgi:putative flippase GtrA